MKEKIEKMKEEALAAVGQAKDEKGLQEIRVRFLGKKGELTAVLKGMKDVPKEERPQAGQFVNDARNAVEEALKEKGERLSKGLIEEQMKRERIDVTQIGRAHV